MPLPIPRPISGRRVAEIKMMMKRMMELRYTNAANHTDSLVSWADLLDSGTVRLPRLAALLVCLRATAVEGRSSGVSLVEVYAA
jgi:hypothetical protein